MVDACSLTKSAGRSLSRPIALEAASASLPEHFAFKLLQTGYLGEDLHSIPDYKIKFTLPKSHSFALSSVL